MSMKNQQKYLKRIFVVLMSITILAVVFIVISSLTHYSFWSICMFGIVSVLAFALYKWLCTYSIHKFAFESLFSDIEFPKWMIHFKHLSFELVFALLLIAVGIDPLKDLIEFKVPAFHINLLFLDLAIFFTFLSFIPMVSWYVYKKYWKIS